MKGLISHLLLKYLVRELLMYFSIAFLFFFLLFFVNQILYTAQTILEKRVPLPQVTVLILYSLPFIIAQSAPFATFVGFIMCLGRLNTDNEILVLRASGKSYMMLLAPVLCLGLGISAASFAVNDYLLPLATVSYQNLYRNIIYSNPAVELESNSVKKAENSMLVIGEVTKQDISDMVFFDADSEGNQRIIVAGKTAVTQPKDHAVLLQLEMSDASVVKLNTEKRRDYDVIDAALIRLNLFTSSFMPPDSTMNPREYTAKDLWRRILEMRADRSVTQMVLNLYKMEFHKKFSLPFGSIFFAFLALPLSILFGKQNGQTIGLVIGIFTCFVYWMIIILGQTFAARSGQGGALTMWFPDALLGVSGAFFYFRLRRK
jgi:lipopolysaccharide export system permease protein